MGSLVVVGTVLLGTGRTPVVGTVLLETRRTSHQVHRFSVPDGRSFTPTFVREEINSESTDVQELTSDTFSGGRLGVDKTRWTKVYLTLYYLQTTKFDDSKSS